MKTNRTRVIEKLIRLADRMADLREGGSAFRRVLTLAELIRTEADPDVAVCGVDAALEVIGDGDAMGMYGWLEGYAELAGYDSVADLLRAVDIGDELLDKIWRRQIVEAPQDEAAPEPAPARVYKAILGSLRTTTRSLLADRTAVVIDSDTTSCLDEYARNAAQAVVTDLEL